MLSVESIRNNPHIKVLIVGEKLRSEGLLLDEEISFSGSNSFNSQDESSAQAGLGSKLSKLSEGFNTIASLAGSSRQVSGFSSKTVQQTLMTWTDSSFSPLTVNMLFLADSPGVDVRKEVLNLQTAVTPTTKGGFAILAPMGYSVDRLSATAKGGVSLKIGSWLRIPKLVITDVSPTFTSTVISTGVPVYVTVAVTLQPYKIFTMDEINQFYIGMK